MMNQIRDRRACLSITLLLSSCTALANDWPLVRGDAAGAGVAEAEIAESLDLLWTFRTDESAFEATPVISGGSVFVGDAEGGFYALRLSEGDLIWSLALEDSGFLSAAAVRDDHVYVGDLHGLVRCFRAKDGALIWKADAETELYAGPNFHGENLLVTTEGGLLLALDAATGHERWRFSIDAPLRCSPTLVAGRILLAGCDARLHAVDVQSGEEVASVDLGDATGVTAASLARRAYFGTEGGTFFAVDAQGTMTIDWTYHDPKRRQGIRTSAAVSDSAVVYASQSKVVYAIHPKTGALLWRTPTKSRVEASPVIAGQRVVVATTRGRLILLDLASGEPLWEYEAGGSFRSAAAVVDGKVILSNDDGSILCFGKAETSATN